MLFQMFLLYLFAVDFAFKLKAFKFRIAKHTITIINSAEINITKKALIIFWINNSTPSCFWFYSAIYFISCWIRLNIIYIFYFDTYLQRGLLYKDIGESKKALADFDKAIQLNPQSPFPFVNRGYLKKEQLNDKDGACKDFNKAEELGISMSQEDKKYCNYYSP